MFCNTMQSCPNEVNGLECVSVWFSINAKKLNTVGCLETSLLMFSCLFLLPVQTNKHFLPTLCKGPLTSSVILESWMS